MNHHEAKLFTKTKVRMPALTNNAQNTMYRLWPIFSFSLLGFCCFGLLPARADQTSFGDVPSVIADFTTDHCLACHDDSAAEGGLDLSTVGFQLNDPATFAKWQRVLERVRDGEMPPETEASPAPEEAHRFLEGLKGPLLESDRADVATRGRVRGRRLTRTEYEYTLYDLLGIDIPLENLLPQDSTALGFETIAETQQLSHHLLAVYLDVADIALNSAFDRAGRGDRREQQFFSPQTLAMRRGGNYRGPEDRDGKSISWPIGLQFFGRMYPTRFGEDGWYRITLRGVHAINPNANGVVWGTLRSGRCEASEPILYMIGLVEATTTPRDLVYEAWIRDQHCLELKPNDAELQRAPTGAKGGNVSFTGRDLAAEGYSGIVHEGILIERINPNGDDKVVRRHLFGEIDPESLAGEEVSNALGSLVSRFARRAFRRPLTDEIVAPYVEIGQQVLAETDSLLEALCASYRAILCSPRFLTFIESPGELDDHAIASRMSYALWTSLPDEELSSLADAGRLRDSSMMASQVERMLADPKSERFINSFTDQWLKLNQINFTTPDTKLYRMFDPVLQESMLQETRAFVSALIKNDLSVASLVDSDFTFANERLARHYQFFGASGEALDSDHPDSFKIESGKGTQQIKLPGAGHRGGLMGQAAILKVTADGTRTSPIVRGVFVNERILGEHIPPPPPGVPAIEPDIRGATSIRDQLDKHRSNESCAACHKLIDPPGFALENFDPIGGWRDRYGVGGKGVAVDASGTTPQGETFATPSDWKRIYVSQPEQLAHTFTSHFLTYATGAPIRFGDAETVAEIVKHASESEFGMKSLIQASIRSPIFLVK